MLKSVVAAMPCDHDGNRFLSEYACRPCFAKLEKGSRHYKNTISLISELRATARATASVKVAVNEPFPLPADSSARVSHGTQTESPQAIQKRPRECDDAGPAPKRPRVTLSEGDWDIEQQHPGITVIVQPAVNEPDTTPVARKRLLESQDAEFTPKGLRLTLSEGSETPTGPCRPQSSPASVLKVSYFIFNCGLSNY